MIRGCILAQFRGLPSSPGQKRGNPVLRIVLQRAWLNVQYPSAARPILPPIQAQRKPNARAEHDVGEQLARLEQDYNRHDSPLLWAQIERGDAPQIDLWPPRDANQRLTGRR
jgi:hypothetical protein